MPNGMIKMLYSGKEDIKFTNNPDINFFRSVYKRYSNFVKVPEKIELADNYNINTTNNFDVELTNNNYDLLGDMYLYIKLNTPIVNNIMDFIKKIDIFCSNTLIDSLTPEILKLYSNIFYSPNKSKIYDLIREKNAKNTFYIPLDFHFLHKTGGFIPLYLLKNENIHVKIYFERILVTDVIAENIDLIGNYYILENKEKSKLKKYKWLIETINYMENVQLNVSIKEDIGNIVNITFNKYCKSLLFVFKKTNISNIKIYINNFRLNYTFSHLKKLTFLHTNLNNNNNDNNENIIIYPFSLFKNDISGYINLDTINKFYLELYPYIINTSIKFDVTNVFTQYYFYVTTDLITTEVNQSPDITIYTNIKYTLINQNCDIIITSVDPSTYSNNVDIPYYSGFDYNSKTLIVNDETTLLELDSVGKYITLYYYHKISSSNPTKINQGKIKVYSDVNALAGLGLVNIYSINYNLYSLEDGKLYNTVF